MTARTPAILGGPAAFPDRLHLLRPTLPPFADLEPPLREVYASGTITKGPILVDYERALAEHLGVRHALGVSSCTAGLMLVFDRYRGADIVLPSFTFMATAMAAVWAGLEPVFADIDPDTWCLSPAAAEAALTRGDGRSSRRCTSSATRPTPRPSTPSAARRGVAVVYDAAHGFGALRDGAPVGRQGLAQVFSTSPTKLLITGEGGVVATDDDELAERVVVGREYGNPGTYDPLFVGLQRAPARGRARCSGLKGLALLEPEAERRNALATVYREPARRPAGVGFQRIRPQDRSSFKDFSVRIRAAEFGLTRDQVAAGARRRGHRHARLLRAAGAPHCRPSPPRGPAFEERLPETAALCDEVLTLPAYGRLDRPPTVERVAACMIALHERAPGVRRALECGVSAALGGRRARPPRGPADGGDGDDDDRYDIDLGDYLRGLLHWWWVVVVLAIVGARRRRRRDPCTSPRPTWRRAPSTSASPPTPAATPITALNTDPRAAIQIGTAESTSPRSPPQVGLGETAHQLRDGVSITAPALATKTRHLAHQHRHHQRDRHQAGARRGGRQRHRRASSSQRLAVYDNAKVALLTAQVASDDKRLAQLTARNDAAQQALAAIAAGGGSAATRAMARAPYLGIVQSAASEMQTLLDDRRTDRAHAARGPRRRSARRSSPAPRRPRRRSRRRSRLNAAVGMVVGLVVGLVAAAVLEWRRRARAAAA